MPLLLYRIRSEERMLVVHLDRADGASCRGTADRVGWEGEDSWTCRESFRPLVPGPCGVAGWSWGYGPSSSSWPAGTANFYHSS